MSEESDNQKTEGGAPISSSELVGLLAACEKQREKHKRTAFCEHPNTCGGCHWWSGYIAAIRDQISGERPTILLKSAERSKQPNAEVSHSRREKTL
jgi:hypothetical protein